jgi:SSS family solute:Na+ symporter
MNPFLLTLLLYGAVLIVLGILLSKSVSKLSDFYVADRKLGPGLLGATILAANIGAGSTIGAASLGYTIGLSGWWWVGSAGIGSVILAFTVGPKIFELASKRGFLTVGDFLEYRYGLQVRALVSGLLWLGSLSILAGQLIAFARILQVVAGTEKFFGSVLGGCVVIAYFSASGLKGTVWINTFQLIIKGAGFLIALPIAMSAVGGWPGIEASILSSEAHDPSFMSLTGIGSQGILAYAVLLVPAFIVSPGLLQKVYGARSVRAVRLGVSINALVLLIFSFFPVVLGMIAAAAFPNLAHGDLALPVVITQLVPIWAGALLLAAIFSAELSSADAILFMLSTSLGKDLYQAFLRPDATDQTVLRLSRWASVLAGTLAVLLAITLPSVISALTIFYSLLSVALFVPLVAGLYFSQPSLGVCLRAISISVGITVIIHFATYGEGLLFFSPTALGIIISAAVFAAAAAVPERG